MFSRDWAMRIVDPRPAATASAQYQQRRLGRNVAAAMAGVPAFIVDRQLGHFDKADPNCGRVVREALQAAGVSFSASAA